MGIRLAKDVDLEEIVKIFITEGKKAPYLQKWTRRKAIEDFKPSLKKKELWVAEIDKKVVGFILVGLVSSNKGMAYVSEFWIAKNYQGNGIGKELLAFVEKYYKKKGVDKIRLASNLKSKAIGFYKKLNYKENKELIFLDKKL